MKTCEDILKYPLIILKVVGLHPETNQLLNKISLTLFLTSLTFLFTVVVIQFLVVESDIYDYVYYCEATIGYIQIGSKVVFTLVHKNSIIDLIEDMRLSWTNKDWNLSDMGATAAILHRSEKLLKAFAVCIVVSTSLMIVSPLFTRNVPIGIWTFEGHPLWFASTMVVQEIGLIFYAPLACTVDALFLAICICVIIRFKFLTYSLRNFGISYYNNTIDRTVYFETLRKCTEQHVLLLRFSKKLSDAISPVMFAVYGSVTVLLCTEMYIFFEGSSTEQLMTVRRPVTVICLLAQLACYCIPADYVTSEALDVSDAIYESDWTSEYLPGSRNEIQLIIQQAQESIKFSAGGLVDINARTLISVLKVSWSACTIIRALKHK